MRRYPPDTASVRDVRQFVAQHLDGVPEEQVEVILLATSELAANSVRHAGTAYTVEVDRSDRAVRVTVEDDGEGDPEVQDPGPFTPSGRGLLIVEQLSDDWGSSSRRGHTRVWFSVRLEPGVASSSGAPDEDGRASGPGAPRSPCRRRSAAAGPGGVRGC